VIALYSTRDGLESSSNQGRGINEYEIQDHVGHILKFDSVASRFGDCSEGLFVPIFGVIKLLFGISVETGARTIVYLASSPDVAAISGRYFEKCRQVFPGPKADDDQAAQRLWTVTSKIAGIDWDR
jgi:hypothetical protein